MGASRTPGDSVRAWDHRYATPLSISLNFREGERFVRQSVAVAALDREG